MDSTKIKAKCSEGPTFPMIGVGLRFGSPGLIITHGRTFGSGIHHRKVFFEPNSHRDRSGITLLYKSKNSRLYYAIN